MNASKDRSVGEIVAEDHRAADVFEKFGIDFCYSGHTTLTEACKKRNTSTAILIEELNKALSQGEPVSFATWQLDVLIHHIEQKHHTYITEKLPVIKRYLDLLCNAYGHKRHELLEINNIWDHCSVDLSLHIKKEAYILFPYILTLVTARKEGIPIASPPFGTVKSPVQMMEHEHHAEGTRFKKLSELTQNYNPPYKECNTYKTTFALLKEFDANLHMQIHLENNILFPKAIELESSFHNQQRAI